MNFSLPGIFIFIRLDTAHNLADSVGSATITLGLSPHHTHRHGVRGGGVRVLSQQEIIPELSVVFLADFPRPGLLPASEHEAVPVNVLPVSRALAERTETGEVHGVGVGHGQPQQGQHVESLHVV